MAETMALETRGLAQEEDGLFAPASRFACWKIVDMPKEGDSAAAAATRAARYMAATWGAMPKSRSCEDFAFYFTDSAANKVEAKTKPAANKVEDKTKPAANKVEDKTKAAAAVEDKTEAASVTSFFEPAARVEAKAALAGSIQPAAKVEAKPKRKPMARVEREPKVVEVKIEKVGESYIEYLRKNPLRRPSPRNESLLSPKLLASCRRADASINELIDLREHILEQYDTKGYAMAKIEYLDNGKKRLYRLPVEDTA